MPLATMMAEISHIVCDPTNPNGYLKVCEKIVSFAVTFLHNFWHPLKSLMPTYFHASLQPQPSQTASHVTHYTHIYV